MEEVSNLYIISDFTYGAEHEYFIGLKCCNALRRELRTLNIVIRSHIAD